MRTDQWQRVEEIYYAALELDANQRHAYLVEACRLLWQEDVMDEGGHAARDRRVDDIRRDL